MKKLYIVIPCYNEEEVIKETTKRLKEKLEDLIINKNLRGINKEIKKEYNFIIKKLKGE